MTARARRRWKAIPPSVKLGAIVLLGAALVTEQLRGLSSWIVQTDELQYVRLALSAGEGPDLTPGIHGVRVGGLSQLYPLVIAPVYQVFDMPTASKAAHVLGAIVMASAAVPAYLLTREVVSSRAAAYVVAALSIATPWSGFALVIGTEVLAYPMFVWGIFALQRAITAPSPGRDLVAILAVAAAYLARTQLLVLAVAFPVAIVLHELGHSLARRPRAPFSALREGLLRAVTGHVLIAGAMAFAVLLAAFGILGELLGPYRSTVGQSALFPPGWFEIALKHLSIVGVATGVLPIVFALSWVPLVLFAPLSKAAHAFAVLASVTGALLYLQASSFVVLFSGPLAADRYFFYIVPLLLVAAAAFLFEGPRHWSAALLGTMLFAAVVPHASFDLATLQARAYQGSPASATNPQLAAVTSDLSNLLSWQALSTKGVLVAAVLLLGLLVAAALRFRPSRRLAWLLVLALVSFGVFQARHASSALRAQQYVGLPGRDWIDRASPSGPAGLVPSPVNYAGYAGTEGREYWWDAEFWNRSVIQAYSYRGATTYTGFPKRRLRVNPVTGRLQGGGGLPRFLILAKDRSDLGLDGRITATNGVLVRVDLGVMPRARWTVGGLTPDGAIPPGRTADLRVYPSEASKGPRRIEVVIRISAGIKARASQRFRITFNRRLEGGELKAGRTAERRFSLCVDTRPATFRIHAVTLPSDAKRSRALKLEPTRVTELTRGCRG